MKTLEYHHMDSPIGILKLIASEKSLLGILWENDKCNRVKLDEMEKNKNHPILLETEKQLQEYFRKIRTIFSIPMEMHGTPFQKAVWEVLNQIPYGEIWTYKRVAEQIKNPKAVRAVGAAIGRNPIPIIVSCHRVIGTNGGLIGFAGGLHRKQILLSLEKQNSVY